MADEDHQGRANDAARAFDDLRAEVMVLRRAIETLPGAWDDNRPPDYSPDLGRIVKGLGALEKRLADVEAQPALTRTPEAYGEAIRKAGAGVVAEAVRELKEAKRETAETGQTLAGMIGSARSRQAQHDKVLWTGLIAFIVALLVGLISSPYLASALPFGWSDSVAAIVMDAGRYQAGEALMQAAHPNRWNNLVAPFNLINGNAANAKAIAACQAEAAKVRKPQMCRIVVKSQ